MIHSPGASFLSEPPSLPYRMPWVDKRPRRVYFRKLPPGSMFRFVNIQGAYRKTRKANHSEILVGLERGSPGQFPSLGYSYIPNLGGSLLRSTQNCRGNSANGLSGGTLGIACRSCFLTRTQP